MKSTSFDLQRRQLGRSLLAGLPVLPSTTTAQSEWPSRPIRLVAPSAVGGATDFVGRTLGKWLELRLKQPVLTENKPGASAIVGAEFVKNSPADGYTFLISGNSTHAANPVLFVRLPYDPQKDFDEVGLVGQFPMIGMVRQDSAIRNIGDLIERAKASPAKISFGYYRASSQVPPELIKGRAQVEFTGVAYKNITQIITDLAGGIIDFAFLDALSSAPALLGGRVIPFAVTSAQRFGPLPNVPTVAETLAGYEMQGWIGLSAPAGTPAAIIERMSALLREALADPEVSSALARQGMSVRSSTAEELRAHAAADRKRWAEWVKAARITPQ